MGPNITHYSLTQLGGVIQVTPDLVQVWLLVNQLNIQYYSLTVTGINPVSQRLYGGF